MGTITYTRKAICKDCRFCDRFKKGNLIRHRCSNPESERYGIKYTDKTITLKDLVCAKWEL